MASRVVPGTQRWDELVSTGNAKVSDTNWFLGDAALEIAPMGEDNSNNGAMADVEQFASEVDVNPGTMRIYRDVAAAWPPPNRIGTSWRVHDVLKADKHRHLIREGMTVREAREAVGSSSIPGGEEDPIKAARMKIGNLSNEVIDLSEKLRNIREKFPEDLGPEVKDRFRTLGLMFEELASE